MQKTLVTNWHTDKENLIGRAPACNVTTVQSGPRGDAKNLSIPLDFHLFISGDMIN